MSNQELARLLEKIADILQIKDESTFRIKAYRNAAFYISHLDEDLQVLYEQKRLDQIPGVGKAIREKIAEILETGTCQYYERLCEEFPPVLLDMLAIPGIGHKTVRLVFDKLGLTTLGELYDAAQKQQIRNIPGMGAKSEEKIIKGIDSLRGMQDKMILGLVLPIARDLCTYLRASDVVLNASPVGSVRRGKPLVSDLDILVASHDELAVRQWVKAYSDIKEIEQEENGHIAGRMQSELAFEVIIVVPEEYAEALFWTTGSKEHRSLVLGHEERYTVKGVPTEQELYRHFNMAFIPPELRENRGEIEAARKTSLPKLLELEDIKGDLHVHSNWSDGSSSIAEMAAAAQALNYEYLAITDHSQSLVISRGLCPERLQAQATEIDHLNRNLKGFKILKGIEVDILKDGSLDLSDEVLKDLDFVVASVHSYFQLDKQEQTERLLNAINNKHVDMIGHLTGRLLNRRPAYEFDLASVLKAAASSHTALEINSHPDRLDIDEEIARKARDMGIKIAINSDAHHKNQLKHLSFGVTTARRGWLEKKDLLNTLSLAEFTARARGVDRII